jgi:SAM-dependent methyltransferase
MKTWYKYFLNYKDERTFLPKDSSFEEHMQWLKVGDAVKGYGSKKDFFKVYFFEAHPRHGYYHDYLKKNIDKGSEVLSIGSGQCVNELLLKEEGFNITCSDLDQFYKKETEKIFPDIRFIKFDITKSSSEHKFDCVISLSMFYLFDEAELLKVFTNVANSLKAGGSFIFDPGGAEDNFLTRIIDDFICVFESHLIKVAQKVIRRKHCVVTKKHQGYRTTNNEIIAIARKAGFQLKDIKCVDYISELRFRTRLFGKLPESAARLFGRPAPYVRIFHFKKTEER